MNQLEFQRNHLQMDYYSESYQDFERDFYRYSNMNIPLTFLTDDILRTMATSHKNYFVLNKEKSKDNRDHFFIFEDHHLYHHEDTLFHLDELYEQLEVSVYLDNYVFLQSRTLRSR